MFKCLYNYRDVVENGAQTREDDVRYFAAGAWAGDYIVHVWLSV